MSKYLKGNYQLSKVPTKGEGEADESASAQEFERRALERLGGSIAFVMKRNTFVWEGDTPKDEKKQQ